MLGISRSSYYAWKNRGISARKQHEQKLLRILISFHEKHPAAGLDALLHMIKPVCPRSRNTLHRLMKLHNIHSIRKKHTKLPQTLSIVTLFHRTFCKEILQKTNLIKSRLAILHTFRPMRGGYMLQSLRTYALRKSSAMHFQAALILTSRSQLWKWL